MFLGDHFSNSTADSGFCKNICGMADFAKKLARIDGFADPYSRSSANIKMMNLDTGKYHDALLTIIFTVEQWLKNIFYHKEHISFHHKIH